jgi:predicted AlkP superfamily phosphohydrolase/phosphomutase
MLRIEKRTQNRERILLGRLLRNLLLAGWLLAGITLLLPGCGSKPEGKVFVLGIDGLTFDLLLPWVQEGKLPHFARLLEEGSSTQLISTIPPISPVAWTTAVTGVNPGKHGIFGFVKEFGRAADGGFDLDFYTAQDRRTDPVWVLLTERGRRSIVINVPCSSPPDRIRGIMISGFPYTSPDHFTHPPEYRLKIPNYRKDHYRKVSEAGEAAYLEDMNLIMDQRAEVLFDLLEEEPWDLFFAVFTITDRVQHYFWKFMDHHHPDWNAAQAELFGNAIQSAYERMDELLGRLRSHLDEKTTLVVMSDHGFGPVYQPVNSANFIETAFSTPTSAPPALSGDTYGASFYITSALARPITAGGSPDDEGTTEELVDHLENLVDPATGKRVLRQIYLKEDLYWGPYAERAPHVVGLENRGYLFWNWHPTDDDRIFPRRDDPIFERFFSGYHVMNGVLMLGGANISKGAKNFHAQLADIAPTLLYLLGEPVPQQMDGRILSEPIWPSYVSQHPLEARWKRSSSSRPGEERSDSSGVVNQYIEEQLRAIGYVQ